MYIDSWDDFAQRARQMFLSDPMGTRYIIRYNHARGKVVAKVTDDKKCWQYKTDQQAESKKMEELNRFLLHLMAGMDPDELPTESAAHQQQPQQKKKRRN